MREIILKLDETLPLEWFDVDFAMGIGLLDGVHVQVVHVRGAREYTVPLADEVHPKEVLRLACAIRDWDVGMMEGADAPFSGAGPKVSAKQVIRSFIPQMYRCEFRDLFVDTYGYAGELR